MIAASVLIANVRKEYDIMSNFPTAETPPLPPHLMDKRVILHKIKGMELLPVLCIICD